MLKRVLQKKIYQSFIKIQALYKQLLLVNPKSSKNRLSLCDISV